jgi:hypothetical protein
MSRMSSCAGQMQSRVEDRETRIEQRTWCYAMDPGLGCGLRTSNCISPAETAAVSRVGALFRLRARGPRSWGREASPIRVVGTFLIPSCEVKAFPVRCRRRVCFVFQPEAPQLRFTAARR